MQQSLRLVTRIYLKLAAVALSVGFILRIVLLLNEQTLDTGFGLGEWMRIFLLGALNDWMALTVGFVFLWLFLTSISERKYARPWGYIILGLLAASFCYVTFFHTVFDDYGSVVPTIVSALTGFWLGSFALRLFVPSVRRRWTFVWSAVLIALYVGSILFNGVSEYFFWNEFGVRYNFIAVDYLVYTNEVIGNIMESYPVWPLVTGVLLATLLLTWYLFRHDIVHTDTLRGWRWKAVMTPAYLACMVAAVGVLHFDTRFQNSGNVYVNELQANGAYKFYDAFVKNELDFRRFYPTLPDGEAREIVYHIYGSSEDNLRTVHSDRPAERRNIVLVTIESMSASFMEHFGCTDDLTPNLDALYDQGIAFERLYATGNRTVRGLEAVTLCLPPCPGQSIIKRPDNADMHATGSMLGKMGYDVFYFYGGNSYFDNMEAFFSGNGYRIVDEKSYAPDQITFANIWGVCDEDAYRKVLVTLNEQYESGKPFFAHVMSVSNHRPYTYPAGKISIPNDAKSRAGGVMYSDYALGLFLREASKAPWFDNTVFVITADHCASSAGKTEIPLGKYHIPGLIYAPRLIAPCRVEQTMSQIDLMPTLFALLGMEYESRFYGVDALDPAAPSRAFIATYQDLGYLEGDTFTVLSPVNRAEQYRIRPTDDDPYRMVPVEAVDSTQLRRAIALYQTASDWHCR